MTEPTQGQIDAADRLGVSLHFTNVPLAVARLVELIEELQRRVESLEHQRKSWLRSK